MRVALLLRGRARRCRVTRVRGRRLIVVALVVGGRRILRGIVLWIVLAIVLRVVLLWTVSLLCFLSVASERNPGKAPGRWRGILVEVTLLLVLRSMDEGHVGPRNPPSPVHGVSEEDRKDDHETDDRDSDTCSSAQSLPANHPRNYCNNSKSRPLRQKIAGTG